MTKTSTDETAIPRTAVRTVCQYYHNDITRKLSLEELEQFSERILNHPCHMRVTSNHQHESVSIILWIVLNICQRAFLQKSILLLSPHKTRHIKSLNWLTMSQDI